MKLSRPIELGKGRQLTEIKLDTLKAKHYKLIPKKLMGIAFENRKIEEFKIKLEKEQGKNGKGNTKTIEELKLKIENSEKEISMSMFEMLPEIFPLLAALSGQKAKIIGELESQDLTNLMSELFDALGGVL